MQLSSGEEIPIEMHKARMVQKIWLTPVEERLKAIEEAGYNTFKLKTKDVFLDMKTTINLSILFFTKNNRQISVTQIEG